MQITVFGSGNCEPGGGLYYSAEMLGIMLTRLGHTVVTGGYDGVMEAVSKGVAEAGGKTIGITLEIKPQGNQYLSETIVAKGENMQKQFTTRLGELLSTDAFVFFYGESSGTYVELVTVLQLSRFCKLGPIVLVDPANRWPSLKKELGRNGFTDNQLGTVKCLDDIEKISDLLE